MQNDLEIAGQLDLLSKKISEGITGANNVLKQVREVELDVSSAEKANAEIVEVIEVEISRAKSEFEVEISRAISEFELEISRAISEVQPEISRAETAKAEIAEVITEGITRANSVIKQAEEVNIGLEKAKAEIAAVIEVEISRAKSEFKLEISPAISEAQKQLEEISKLTEQNESTYNKFLQEKLELNEIYTSFESLIKEIGGSAGLEKLRRELQEGREVAFKLETYHQQENPKLLLENMDKQQKDLIRQGKLAIVIVSVWVFLISLLK